MSFEPVEYTAMLLGATGNVGGRILHLLVQSPLCTKVVVVTRRNVAQVANVKVQQVVVNMDTLEEELTPHARGVDLALAAFGVGKGSAKMADEEVRKIEVAYPTAFASAAKDGGARVLAMMTSVGADSQSSNKYLRNMGVKASGISIDTSEPEQRYLPGHPDADANGYVKMPRMNPAEDMVDIMSASRSYQDYEVAS